MEAHGHPRARRDLPLELQRGPAGVAEQERERPRRLGADRARRGARASRRAPRRRRPSPPLPPGPGVRGGRGSTAAPAAPGRPPAPEPAALPRASATERRPPSRPSSTSATVMGPARFTTKPRAPSGWCSAMSTSDPAKFGIGERRRGDQEARREAWWPRTARVRGRWVLRGHAHELCAGGAEAQASRVPAVARAPTWASRRSLQSPAAGGIHPPPSRSASTAAWTAPGFRRSPGRLTFFTHSVAPVERSTITASSTIRSPSK